MDHIEHGASLHISDSNGEAPLHLSTKHPGFTRRLLSLGADPYAKAKYGTSTFHCVIMDYLYGSKPRYLQIEVLKAYAEAGVDFDVSSGNGWKAVHMAACLDPSLILVLLELGSSVKSLTDDEGWSLLHVLLFKEQGRSMIHKFPVSLLQGLNPDMADNYGLTPIDYLEILFIAEKDSIVTSRAREALLFVKLVVELRELD